MARITAIVPVYKVELYLRRCVDSILRQTFEDFELILVDDGSPDSCPTICDEYAVRDSRVHVIHQENGGLSAARNAGIDWAFEKSNSEWITFIDSDDWVHETYLQSLYSVATQFNTNISICNYSHSSGNETHNPKNLPPYVLSPVEAYTKHYNLCMSACFKIYKKHIFKDYRFPVGKLHEDAFITHLLLFNENEVAITEECLYFYFVNTSSITKSPWSPKRSDDVDAHESRLHYFYNKDLVKPLQREFIAYILCLTYQIKEIDLSSDNYSNYRDFLLKKLRKTIKISKKYINLNSKNHLEVFETAYPVRMWFYWRLLAISRKLKRLFTFGLNK